jgi:glycosyltransferase involved in cell wall biosynthesis
VEGEMPEAGFAGKSCRYLSWGRTVKILHLLSNWKWTERSEPAADLALAQELLGADVTFVCSKSPPGTKYDVEYFARRKGLNTVVALKLPKHLQVLSARRSVADLIRLEKDLQPDIIHCHLQNAHLLAGLTKKKTNSAVIVRSCYRPEGPQKGLRAKFLYKYHTDGFVVISKKAKDAVVNKWGFAPEAVQLAEPGINLGRFSPQKERPAERNSFGLDDGSFVVGVVSRIRKTRRLDVPLEAVAKLANAFPQLRLLVVGRGSGSAVKDVFEDPAARMGISDRVVLAGYCYDERLVAAYGAMDVLVYPVPGTDKSCRTVREAMASAVPVVASKIGFLPELVHDGVNGRLMQLSPGDLASILPDLIKNRSKLNEMSQNALRIAQQRFDPMLQAKKTLSLYDRILGSR